jgi:nucleoid-associated protein YgaU
MANKTRSKFLSLTLAVSFLLLGTGSGCGLFPSSHHGGSSDDAAANPDAGTDAVPQAAVEDRSATPPAAIAEDSSNNPPPPTDDSAVPPAPVADNSVPAPTDAVPQAAASVPAPTADVASAPVPAPPVNDSMAGMNSSGSSNSASTDSNTGGGGSGSYRVRSGETLMMIAFENYGDLYKWKDIYEMNKDHISNPNSIPAGTILKLDQSQTGVAIDKNGDQYLIKHGDTLGKISNDVYGTQSKWKKIWNNNKQLIKDPNKIYAGFYLYYSLTPGERENLEKRGNQVSPAPLAQEQSPGPAPASVNAARKTRNPASVRNNTASQQLIVPPPAPALVPVPAMTTTAAGQPADLNQLVH